MLNADPTSNEANSYATLVEAELIANQRLYTAAWDALSVSPSAANWVLLNNELLGATTIELTGGVGTFNVGNVVRINGVMYSVVDVTVPTAPVIAPGLAAAATLGTSFERITLNAKEKALANATSMLDAQVDWDGSVSEIDQPLRWPRTGAYNCDEVLIDSDVFPTELKTATVELAFVLAGRNTAATPSLVGLGIKSAKVAEIEVEVDGTITGGIDALSQYVQDLVACLGKAKSSGGGSQVRLVRV